MTTTTNSTDASPTLGVPLPEHLAFTAAARTTPSCSLTACRGWTAHDVLVHVVAGGAEMARLIGEHLNGAPPSATVTFEDREPAFRAVDHDVLVELVAGGSLGELIAAVDAADSVPFTGWSMDAAALTMHLRSELALHRWDLVGSDDMSIELLSQPDLTRHAVRALGAFDVISERVTARDRRAGAIGPVGAAICLHSAGEPDVVVIGTENGTVVRIEDAVDGPGITTDPAARLLMLWGRRPPLDRHVVMTDLDPARLSALDTWLFG